MFHRSVPASENITPQQIDDVATRLATAHPSNRMLRSPHRSPHGSAASLSASAVAFAILRNPSVAAGHNRRVDPGVGCAGVVRQLPPWLPPNVNDRITASYDCRMAKQARMTSASGATADGLPLPRSLRSPSSAARRRRDDKKSTTTSTKPQVLLPPELPTELVIDLVDGTAMPPGRRHLGVRYVGVLTKYGIQPDSTGTNRPFSLLLALAA